MDWMIGSPKQHIQRTWLTMKGKAAGDTSSPMVRGKIFVNGSNDSLVSVAGSMMKKKEG